MSIVVNLAASAISGQGIGSRQKIADEVRMRLDARIYDSHHNACAGGNPVDGGDLEGAEMPFISADCVRPSRRPKPEHED
jgi:hypothetical protein